MTTLTKPTTSTTTTPGPAPDPGVEIPLVDWGSLALRAGRIGPVLPHMAWLLRFPDRIEEVELREEARRLASTPYGFGRRIAPPRLPGGRHRWRQETAAPAPAVRDRPVQGADALAAWVDRELGVPLDPEHDAGWRIAAAPTDDGGTAVLVVAHHLFGTGGGILNALYGDETVDPTVGTTETRFDREHHFTLRREAAGVAERFRLGVGAVGELAGSAWSGLRRIGKASDTSSAMSPLTATLPAPIPPSRGRDRTRRPASNLRVAAVATVEDQAWDLAAAAHGGSGNTLLAAVAANLLRRAREARGARMDRTLRLLLPVDLTDRDVARVAIRSSGPAAAMTTAEVVLGGGPPVHDDLSVLRSHMKAAFIRDSESTPAVRGAGDVMRLFPERVAFEAAARAALRFDGCASNVGKVPPGMLRIGEHVANDAALMGFPIGNEAITALIRYRDRVAVTVVTDPLRLGPAADLRDWLAAELGAWGLHEVVW